ncbi:MAG TPA: hypothetical protein VKU88_12265 [Acidimicrobiales bacterium]|nr:hypothetical protein [Acidimicrobiales bacterium]
MPAVYLEYQESVGVDSCGVGTWSSSDAYDVWYTDLPSDGYQPRTVFGYIGGENAASACGSAGLVTPSTESTLDADLPPGQTWGIGDIYDGLQAPAGCGGGGGDLMSGVPSTALDQGQSDAASAAQIAIDDDLYAVIYDDMEGYDDGATDAAGYSCELVVTSYLNGWDNELQNLNGIDAGVYGSASSTIKGLLDHLGDNGMHEPDFIWTGSGESLWNVPYVPNANWLYDQRDVQYGSDSEEIGTQLLTFDTDCVDAGMNDGLNQVVWDQGGSNDGGGSEGSSDAGYDSFC